MNLNLLAAETERSSGHDSGDPTLPPMLLRTPPAGVSNLVEADEIVVSVRGLRKNYGQREAVRGISFDVRHGEIFGFLGPNGAGKTTTIEILEGYRQRTSGEVEVLGVDPAKPTRGWRERIGLVLQECELDPNLTVRETVSLFSEFYPSPLRIDETIDLVGLTGVRNMRVGRLSGGQQRRVDVALGIVGNPDLIFLDEPTTGFDPSARRAAWTMIEGLRSLGKTIFLTTHYMDEAQYLADRIAILRAGRLVAVGTVSEIGDRLRGEVAIRFLLPCATALDEIERATGTPSTLSGGIVTIHCDDPQPVLYRLFSWAEPKHLAIRELEVVRPTLEDMFLELTKVENFNA